VETKSSFKRYSLESFRGYLYEIRFIILFYVLGDWLTTWYAIPFAYEENPILAFVLDKYGIFPLLYLKIIFLFLLFFCAGVIKNSPFKWSFTKRFIEISGLILTISNLRVIWGSPSLFQVIGLL